MAPQLMDNQKKTIQLASFGERTHKYSTHEGAAHPRVNEQISHPVGSLERKNPCTLASPPVPSGTVLLSSFYAFVKQGLPPWNSAVRLENKLQTKPSEMQIPTRTLTNAASIWHSSLILKTAGEDLWHISSDVTANCCLRPGVLLRRRSLIHQ